MVRSPNANAEGPTPQIPIRGEWGAPKWEKWAFLALMGHLSQNGDSEQLAVHATLEAVQFWFRRYGIDRFCQIYKNVMDPGIGLG